MPQQASARRATAQAGRQRSGNAAADRDAVLGQHVGLVHHVARRLARHLSTEADLDEMVSAGAIGLVQAVDSFDRARGLSFSTYAVPRIRGAILDELRRQDVLPRNVRRRVRMLTRARDCLTARLQRPPTDDEVTRVLDVDSGAVRSWEYDGQRSRAASLDEALDGHPGVTLADAIADERSPAIDDFLTHEREVARLRVAIAGLKEQERTVLALNFFENLRLQDIARVLGLSVCRISQVRSAALVKLRAALSDLRVS